MTRKDELHRALDSVRRRIAAAEKAAGRPAASVRLLPVSKFHPVEDIALLAELGVDAVGENREQEARAKAEALPQVNFHMIGQIQAKKTNSIARWAAAVHSVDSVRIAEHLDHGVARAIERGERAPGTLDCFVQWSADSDTARGGVDASGLDDVYAAIEKAEHLNLRGLMCVPPLGADAEETYRTARRLAGDLELSAGMSADLEAAIAAGSDIVRVGTQIFGPRPVA